MARAHASLYGVARDISICWSAALVLALAACGSDSSRPAPGPRPHFKIGQPYKINGQWYYPEFVTEYDAIGVASWYGIPITGGRPPTARSTICTR
jgi:rare lipoprotein A (peptidoglycan hydrolase)